MRCVSVRRCVQSMVVLLVTCHVSLVTASSVWADEPSNAELKEEIQNLKTRLSQLEAKLEKGPDSSTVPPTGGESSGPAMLGLPSGLQGVQLSGFVDTIYTYNFNEPNNRVSGFRVFDTRAEDFMINNAQLTLEKPVSSESPVGFKTELMFGTDAEVVGSVTTGLGVLNNEVELQEGYAEYLAPVGNGLDIKLGKFATLHGAEVIESKDNWNISRSFLFGFAIPFTHTGVRATYPWTEWLSTVVGLSNGWDVVDDNNKAKTVELGATVTPFQNFSLGGTYMFGAEQNSDSHDQRHLLDLVATYQPLEKLTLKLNVDIAQEEDAISETGGGNAHWNGLAAYAKYDVTDWWSVAGRWEVFNDDDGARTAVNAASTSPTGSGIEDLRLMGWTLTNEVRLNKHLIGRLEYRLDKADSKVFRHDQGFSNYQNTVAVELIAPF